MFKKWPTTSSLRMLTIAQNPHVPFRVDKQKRYENDHIVRGQKTSELFTFSRL